MEAYNSGGSSPFGEDMTLRCRKLFPYTLYSDNFLPSYGAVFEWRRDSLNSPIIASTPTYAAPDSGTYYLTVNYGNGCQVTDDIHLSYEPDLDTTYIRAAICEGSYYTKDGFNENREGVFYRNASNIDGCDSVIELTLEFTDLLTDTLSAVICQGNTYDSNGFNENKAGVYQLLTQSADGICDSLVTLFLSENPTDNTPFSQTICEGELYDFYGQNVSDSGTYQHFLLNQYGCDSILELNLIIIPAIRTPLTAFTCQDTPYPFAGKELTEEGVYRDTLQASQGCDSIVELTLSIDPLIVDFEITTKGFLCEDKYVELTVEIESFDYQWSTGETSQTIRVSEEGFYSVEVTAGLCQAEKEIEVACPCKLLLHNVFTPNNDGANDVYLPEARFELHSFSMIIYNRWGRVVYQTNTFSPWDGTVDGKPASDGVYYCVVEYYNKMYPTKKCVANSSVTIFR
jgi:gliding motility-associated-like protein